MEKQRKLAGNRILTWRDKGQIGNTADVYENGRRGKTGQGRKRAMEDGHEGRPLPAFRNIGGAKIRGLFFLHCFEPILNQQGIIANGSACGPVIVPVFKTGDRYLAIAMVGSTPTRFRQNF